MTIRFATAALLALMPIAPLAAQAAPPAPPAPQPITRTAFMQKIDSNFVAADTNKDGFADSAELEAVQIKEFNAEKAALMRRQEAVFKQLDKDNNGSLSLAEFSAPIANATFKSRVSLVLGKFDTNKDGKVSLAENRAPAMSQFDRADTNKDGVLSVAEQKAAAARR